MIILQGTEHIEAGIQMADSKELLTKISDASTESEFFSPMPAGYKPGKTKYVFVMGTVMSGLGKGIFSSCLAKLLQDKGLKVAPIKLEGYLNIDSGTLNPFRHGEVFVLDDGMETRHGPGHLRADARPGPVPGQLHHQRADLQLRAEQGAPRRLPGPRRADDPARDRRGEAAAARAGRQQPRPTWSSSRSAARSATSRTPTTSRPCASWPTRKGRAAVASSP